LVFRGILKNSFIVRPISDSLGVGRIFFIGELNMKKFVIILALFLIVGAISVFAQDSFTVNLSQLPAVRNPEPIESPYGAFMIEFPEGIFPANLPWAQYNRIRVVFKYFRANGTTEVRQGNENAFVVLVYDPNGDVSGPPQGPGPNTPVKIFNVGGNNNATGAVSSEGGAGITPLTKAPGAIMLQRQGPSTPVRYIELVELTFFKR
jgi:hypothetical protein